MWPVSYLWLPLSTFTDLDHSPDFLSSVATHVFITLFQAEFKAARSHSEEVLCISALYRGRACVCSPLHSTLGTFLDPV